MLIELTINNQTIKVKSNSSILQACSSIGIELPRFCYHEKLSPAGNCRMCLVEIEKAPKLVASCATTVQSGMKIQTNSEKVLKARENVLEFLLMNHPLDCPICDQGGECDLQDETLAFGSDRGKFYASKRAIKNKELGPIIKTVMNRCIQCTRCIRFSREIAGIQELGVANRGSHEEIINYLEQSIHSNLSGNLIDICPVGALTSKSYAFKARPWELSTINSIDTTDGYGSNIQIQIKTNKIYRIQPLINQKINQEWLTDKTRYSFDALTKERITKPLVKENKIWKQITWEESFKLIQSHQHKHFTTFSGGYSDLETLMITKDLLNKLNSSSTYSNYSYSKQFEQSIEQISHSDLILLIGTELDREAPLLKLHLKNNSIFIIGDDLIENSISLGTNINLLIHLLEGKHPILKKLLKAKNPLIIFGESISHRKDHLAFYQFISQLKNHIPHLKTNWIITQPNIVGEMELGFKNERDLKIKKEKENLIILLGDNINLNKEWITKDNFIISINYHFDPFNPIDLYLPGLHSTEKEGLFISNEGRVQETKKAIDAEGVSDWKILKALSVYLGINLKYETRIELHNRIKEFIPFEQNELLLLKQNENESNKEEIKWNKRNINSEWKNYYNVRNSKTMFECKENNKQKTNYDFKIVNK